MFRPYNNSNSCPNRKICEENRYSHIAITGIHIAKTGIHIALPKENRYSHSAIRQETFVATGKFVQFLQYSKHLRNVKCFVCFKAYFGLDAPVTCNSILLLDRITIGKQLAKV